MVFECEHLSEEVVLKSCRIRRPIATEEQTECHPFDH